MAATGYSSAGMIRHPYFYSKYLPNSRVGYLINEYAGSRWVHNPMDIGWTAFKGANLAGTIGQGNFMTRNYRQKPLNMLQKSEHSTLRSKLRNKVLDKVKSIDIPTVSQRRTKNYSTKKILRTNNHKMVKYSRPRRVKRPFRGRRRKMYRRKKLPPLTIPRSKMVRFRVMGSANLAGATGAIGATYVKANGLNDPTFAFGALLPTSLDQWSALYSKYTVLGAKLTVRASPTQNTGPGVIGVHLADNTTTLTSFNHYRSLPRTVQKVCTTQKDFVTLVMKYSGKKFWKLPNIRDNDNQEGALSTTPGDPTDVAYFHIYVQDMIGGHSFSCDVQVEIEYICLLTDPVQLAESSL